MEPKGRQKREEFDVKRGLDTYSLWHRTLALPVLSHFEWKVWKVLEITQGSRSRRDFCYVPLPGRILKFQLILWSEYNLNTRTRQGQYEKVKWQINLTHKYRKVSKNNFWKLIHQNSDEFTQRIQGGSTFKNLLI